MGSAKLFEKICRICLEEKVILDWNEKMFEFCSISYKECYYKYTKLDVNDSDCFSTNFCEACANELKDAHIFFEKALESFKFLQVTFATKELDTIECIDMEIYSSKSLNGSETFNFDKPKRTEFCKVVNHTADKPLIEVEDVLFLSNEHDNTSVPERTNSKIFNKMSINKYVTIEPRSTTKAIYSDIKRIESVSETSLELTCSKRITCESKPKSSLKQILTEHYNTNLPKLSLYKKNLKRKKYEPFSDASSEETLGSSSVAASTNLSVVEKGTNKRITNKSFSKTSLEQKLSGGCNIKLTKLSKTNKTSNKRKTNKAATDTSLKQIQSAYSDTESPLTSTNKSAYKSRDKYKLMCAYCSLKVHGAYNLRKHEATHSENRKRTETCPECGLKLFTKLALKSHMKIHDQHRQKNHRCEFCEKAFYNKGALNVHRRIHLGLMVKCQLCSKEFFRQVDLNKHLLKHSVSPVDTNVDEKIKYAVKCQYCNKSVLTSKWKEHKAVHMDQPQVKCTICEKNFFSRHNCINHLRRFHHKNKDEYDEFIHYYADRNTRTSSLLIKQQETVQPLIK